MYAEVVVNLLNRRLDRTFHYHVPENLLAEMKEGMQVIVPFGSQVVDGYVVGFTDSAGIEKTKDIIGIAEEEPVFDHNMLELARWMSRTYLCSLVDSLHVLMPPGLKLKKKKQVIFGEASLEDKPALIREAYNKEKEPYKDLIEFFRTRKGIADLEELNKKFGKRAVEDFIEFTGRYDVGGTTTGFSPGVRRKKYKQVCLPEDVGAEIDKLVKKLGNKAPKQAQVLEILASEGGAISLRDLQQCRCSPAAVRALVQKGLLEMREVEEYRDPFGNKDPGEYHKHELTKAQAVVLAEINKSITEKLPNIFLLHGVTGSGKTEVYLQAIETALQEGKEAICLVPEISLTPQTVKRFRGRFGNQVAVLHSALSAGERYDQWRQIRDGRVKVVVGARSAIFAPVGNPGLIILDEEHETTYKQEDNPRYHAREVAFFRARQTGCPVILGSATPSIETFFLAREGKIRLMPMPGRVGGRPMPKVDIVDMREEMESGNRSIFSSLLTEKIAGALSRQEQVILFLNRRGYSTFVACRQCGFVVRCKSCNISLTYHAAGGKMRCHYCGYEAPAPTICPVCNSRYIRYFGLGTQRVEDEIQKLYPQARVLRMDVDTTVRKGSHEEILARFAQGEADLLIGTQMIAKGHDFPKVTVVGVVAADISLNLPDFRSAERTFQLLTQVAGRAGRDQLPGSVVVQTYEPEHYSIRSAAGHDYRSFYEREEAIRKALEYPPFCQLARIVISGFDDNKVIRAAHLLADKMQLELRTLDLGINQPLLGPAPAPLAKLRNKYRWQICLKASERKHFTDIINKALFDSGLREHFKNLNFSIEIDPQSLL